jgi:hypothetical protein
MTVPPRAPPPPCVTGRRADAPPPADQFAPVVETGGEKNVRLYRVGARRRAVPDHRPRLQSPERRARDEENAPSRRWSSIVGHRRSGGDCAAGRSVTCSDGGRRTPPPARRVPACPNLARWCRQGTRARCTSSIGRDSRTVGACSRRLLGERRRRRAASDAAELSSLVQPAAVCRAALPITTIAAVLTSPACRSPRLGPDEATPPISESVTTVAGGVERRGCKLSQPRPHCATSSALSLAGGRRTWTRERRIGLSAPPVNRRDARFQRRTADSELAV